MKNSFSRRTLLHGATALTGLGLLGPANSRSATTDSIDFGNPADNVRTFAKLAGSVNSEAVHYFYSGTIFGMTPVESQPLFRYSGVMKYVWRPTSDGSYRYRMYDSGYYADLDTGQLLEEFTNPYTQEVVRPLHPRAGPYDFIAKPELLDWRRSGDEIWTADSAGLQLPNKLDPAEWPLGSTGKVLNFRYEFGFRGKVSDLQRGDVASAPCLQYFSEISPWYPFLRMGKRPGFNFWSLQGKKIDSLSDISSETLAYFEKHEPGFFDTDTPWDEKADSYTQYMNAMLGRPVWDR
jgi:hypothetical protein